mgnify:CR=1 FL=1
MLFRSNKSLEFSQNTDFVSFGDTHDNGNNTFQFGTSAFSISVWVKPSKLVANNQIFGAHGGSGWTICSLNGGIFTFFAGGFGDFTGGSLTTGVWQHLVVTRDGTVFNMYLNKSKTSHTVSVSNVNTASIFYTRLGWDGGSLPSIHGLIDEAAVWNVALTDADVTALYDNGPNDLNAEESYDTNLENEIPNDGTSNIPAKLEGSAKFYPPTPYSVEFTGSTAYMNTGSTFQSTFQSDFSVSCWFKQNSVSSHMALFGSRKTSAH